MNQNHISHREQPNIRIELSSQKYHPHKINEIFHKKKIEKHKFDSYLFKMYKL